MIRIYFKIAFRNLKKNKIFSAINLLGLAIGLTSFMLIASFVYNELSFDRYAADSERIDRVQLSVIGNGDVAVYPSVDFGVGSGMKTSYPEVKSFTRLSSAGTTFINYGDKQFKEEHLAYADSNFIDFFSLPLISGNISTALTAPNCIVISRTFANKYFGSENPLGKTLKVGRSRLFTITGLFEKIPDNSHFHFDAFLSIATLHITNPTWTNIGCFTYLRLEQKADHKKLQAKFPQLVSKYIVPEAQHDMGVSLAEAQKTASTFSFSLMPLTDIHLHSNTKFELEPNGEIQYVYIFMALAIFILTLACINFTNLSTATAVKRAREVGIRKVKGSLKKQLISQFLMESVLLTFVAMSFSYLLIFLLLPYFNHLAGRNISFSFFEGFKSILAVIFLGSGVGLLAGIYPSFFLSSFNTIKILKGSSLSGSSKNTFRSSLVVFQFFVSTTLIIVTIIVYQQLHFMQNKKLGYDKDQVMYLPDANLLGPNQAAFKQKLIQDSRVVSASYTWSAPGAARIDGTEIFPKNAKDNGVEIHSNIYYVDYDFLNTLGIHLVRGRNLSRQFPTDSSAALINEAAVQQLGWSGTDPIGKSIVRSGQKEYRVIGIVADFHYASVKQRIAPLMMLLANNYAGMLIKLKTDNVNEFISDLKKQWDSFKPAGPMEYNFIDEQFASLYRAEQNTGKIFTCFTIIAILIASLGLFGLATFITEQRTKEIGIRKVLGATVHQVLVMVSREFLLLVAVACIISTPISWWAMNSWLQDFAYRIKINGWIFPLSGFVALLIALLTVSFQAIKAAISNPIKSLRSE